MSLNLLLLIKISLLLSFIEVVFFFILGGIVISRTMISKSGPNLTMKKAGIYIFLKQHFGNRPRM